jgi:hypothetical protein
MPSPTNSTHKLSIVNRLLNIVTDLTNALPGNSSVNTVQSATIEEVGLSVSAVMSHSGGWSRVMCFL